MLSTVARSTGGATSRSVPEERSMGMSVTRTSDPRYRLMADTIKLEWRLLKASAIYFVIMNLVLPLPRKVHVTVLTPNLGHCRFKEVFLVTPQVSSTWCDRRKVMFLGDHLRFQYLIFTVADDKD